MLSDTAEPVNLGNPKEMSIRALAEKIIAITGSSSRIVEKPLPADDPKVRRPDITRARTILDWEPQVPLDEGLAPTLEYFRRKLGLY
jgi:nucleoside-diphosphate-sugar epimerase